MVLGILVEEPRISVEASEGGQRQDDDDMQHRGAYQAGHNGKQRRSDHEQLTFRSDGMSISSTPFDPAVGVGQRRQDGMAAV